jgi:hypothetical protein
VGPLVFKTSGAAFRAARWVRLPRVPASAARDATASSRPAGRLRRLRKSAHRQGVAILGSLFALVGRFAGRVLNSALGWATILLFGKVEGKKQTILLVIALAAIVWVVVLVGIAVPDVGTFLIALVPVPTFIDENIVRLVMLAAAVAIPLLVGIAAVFVTEASSRPGGPGLVRAILRGYPFTLVLAVTIALLSVVALLRKVRSLGKRWEDTHVPVIVKPGGYDQVLGDLEEVLHGAGLKVDRRQAPTVLSLPPRLLDAVAGRALGALVPDRLMLLRTPDLEVLVYPSDIGISGSKSAVARARAAIASKLTESPAYLTTSAESEKIEDAIRQLAGLAKTDPMAVRARLRDLDERLANLEVPFDEWETVYRERLQIEARLRHGHTEPGQEAPTAAPATATVASSTAEAPLMRILGWASLGLIVADVGLLIAERIRPPRRG